MTNGASASLNALPLPANKIRLTEAEFTLLLYAEASGVLIIQDNWHRGRVADAVAALMGYGYLAADAAGSIGITAAGRAAHDAEDLLERAVCETGVLHQP